MKKALFAEFLGTFLLLLAGAGSIIVGKVDLLGVALAHGLAIFVAATALGAISGGHFNPAISLAFFATKRISGKDLVLYIVSQLAGATVASLLLKWIFDGTSTPGFTTATSTQALVAEAVATATLALVIWGSAVDTRNNAGGLAPLAIGLTITANIMTFGPLTGAALNPARWFGPALVAGSWNNAWVYIVGPSLGAIVAALSYEYFVDAKK